MTHLESQRVRGKAQRDGCDVEVSESPRNFHHAFAAHRNGSLIPGEPISTFGSYTGRQHVTRKKNLLVVSSISLCIDFQILCQNFQD